MKQIVIKKTEETYFTREAFKKLHTNVNFCGDDVRVISITSATPSEGKSKVAFNLARSFAEAGEKVLLIDADIRKSAMARRFEISETVNGLSHYLVGKETMEDVICETDQENFSIILAGPSVPNPPDLLANEYFTLLLKEAREKFDYVIVDCPPLGAVIDAAIISAKCDGVLMVVSAGKNSYRMAQDVKSQLERSGCRILGGVLNEVPMDDHRYYKGYYRYYYRGYYRYYKKYGEEDSKS